MAKQSGAPYFYTITCQECGARIIGQHNGSITLAREAAERKVAKHNRAHRKERLKQKSQ